MKTARRKSPFVAPTSADSKKIITATPPELEILDGKDPGDTLFAYGYPDSRINELGFRKPSAPKQRSPKIRGTSRKSKRTLPPGLERLSYESVEEILDDEGYTKSQIAELGFRRFGIPKKFMLHSRKYEAVMSVRNAVMNERILDEISEQARKAGRTRSA